MKIAVLSDQCMRCGLCVSVPENEEHPIFEFGDDGFVKVINDEVNETSKERVAICPVQAIVITEK